MINTEQSIIKALAYFNIFSYPLRKDEVYSFLDISSDKNSFEQALDTLCQDGIVYRIDEFYSLQKNSLLAERRKKGSQLAAGQLKIAARISRFLYRFPFVKGIAVSGSLSKNYADKNSDIDFFIITKANRLWVARTFMHLFKKLTFLTGRQHWFCMNYFIDELALEIKEKNVFTSIEVLTVIPLQGNGIFNDFFTANKWTKSFFPVHQRRVPPTEEHRKGIIKAMAEHVLDNRLGDRLNGLLMRITLKRWNKKAAEHQRSYRGELLGLDGTFHYAKPDPSNFQRNILRRYELEAEAFMMRLENVHAG